MSIELKAQAVCRYQTKGIFCFAFSVCNYELKWVIQSIPFQWITFLWWIVS